MRITFINGLITTLLLTSTFSFAQTGHDHHEHPFVEDDFMLNETQKRLNPHLADKITAKEKELAEFTAAYIKAHENDASRNDESDYIIPVVFHVLHQNGPELLTDTEIHDAMRILNEDFQKRNADTSDVISAFQSIVGDARIEFRLAKRDPQGNPHSGIDRISSSRTFQAGESSKLNTWPRSTYLNVWIVNSIGSGAAGYTFLPSTAHWRASTDGIILLYTYFSSVRTGNERRSRALTHEIGHWLNLEHPWGGTNTPGLATNCNTDDGIFDTPLTVGWTSCNVNGSTCGSLDNVQNFMEYSYCSNMFTARQVLAMQATLNSPVAQRNQLVSFSNNKSAGVLDLHEAMFSTETPVACTGEMVQFQDDSYYDVTNWSWEFEGGNPSTSTEKNPQITYANPGSYKVKLTVRNKDGVTKTKTVENFIRINRSVGHFLPYSENFESYPDALVQVSWYPINEDNDNIYWRLGTGTGYSGDKYLMLENFDNLPYQVESVISDPIDLSNIKSPKLTFKVAHAEIPGQTASDIFRVFVSSDCGETWNLRQTHNGNTLADGKSESNAFFPTQASDWYEVTFQNFSGNDFTQNLMVRFEVEKRGGNNFFIDDINLTGSYDDVPVLEFPLNGMDSVSSDVFLDWKAVPYVTRYEYAVSEDAQFSASAFQGTKDYIDGTPNNDDTRFKPGNLTPGKTYYWRVRTHRGTFISDWSQVWSFTVSASGQGHEYIDGVNLSTSEVAAKDVFTQVKLYPNPATDEVNIQIEQSRNTELTVTLVDLKGQILLQEDLEDQNNLRVNTSHFETGIYFVLVNTGQGLITEKLIVR
ncbi:T9SS type A sorting domain-containing protein [bacterium SCSIO 12741]|nr:T9SS type A sorting domain-containing protein [bacterium SCSIO 12741]